jgi:formylglycine-generating enzyme required for sulfatase activity
MVFIPGGTFRMGSDKHYAEEAPAHRVSVDGFWIDRTPVTNRSLRWHGRNRPLSDTLPAIR